VIPDVYSKIVAVFDKALDPSSSSCPSSSSSDRHELARFYLEYLQENCHQVAALRATEAALKARGLLGPLPPPS